MPVRPPTSASLPPPDDFSPEKFRKKSNVRDYAIYALVLVVAVGVIGGAVYYFTRSESEKDKLMARFDQAMGDDPRLPELKEPKLDGVLGEEAAAKAPPVAERKTESRPVGVSTYSGGGPNRVMLSTDPKLPRASLAFIQYTEALRVSSVVQGNPAKVMIAGKLFRAGEVIDPEQGVTFVGVDGVKTAVILRDPSGAELRLSY